jgi:hypothetical protein
VDPDTEKIGDKVGASGDKKMDPDTMTKLAPKIKAMQVDPKHKAPKGDTLKERLEIKDE